MFEKLEKPVLHKVAHAFGVEYAENAQVKTIVKRLEEDGVTWEMAVAQIPEVAAVEESVREEVATEQAAKREESAKTLIRMTRDNFSWEERGYRFTKTAPFALVTEEDAEFITENIDGFRYATPKEVAEFYG